MTKTKHIIFFVVMILTYSKNIVGQNSNSKIEEFYETQDSIGLNRFITLWYHPHSDSLENINDTLFTVYQIHKSILIQDRFFRGHRSKNNFFFLQPKFPEVYFGKSKVQMPTSSFYNYLLACDTIRPLESNPFWIEEIKAFLGEDPVSLKKPYILRYLKDRRPNRNDIHKKAFKEIKEYDGKVDFLHKIFDICYTWGHIAADYTFLTITSIKFQNDLLTARVEWSCCAYGGDYLYEYKNGTWVQTKTFANWNH